MTIMMMLMLLMKMTVIYEKSIVLAKASGLSLCKIVKG